MARDIIFLPNVFFLMTKLGHGSNNNTNNFNFKASLYLFILLSYQNALQ